MCIPSFIRLSDMTIFSRFVVRRKQISPWSLFTPRRYFFNIFWCLFIRDWVDRWRTRGIRQQPAHSSKAQEHSTTHTAQHTQQAQKPRRFPLGHVEKTDSRVFSSLGQRYCLVSAQTAVSAAATLFLRSVDFTAFSPPHKHTR